MLCGEGANAAILGLMQDYASALMEAGFSVIQVSFEAAELQYVIDLMQKGEIKFAVTWLGFAQDLMGNFGHSGGARNVFEHYGVPLVKLQGDLPAYYIDFHRDMPRNAVNLYQAEEFVHFRNRWLPDAKALTALLPPMPMVPLDRGRIDIESRRNGTLFFVKNGNSPGALENMWDATLPAAVATTARQMARELTVEHVRAGRLALGDWVASFLESQTHLYDVQPKLIWFYAAQMDDYLRRVKSTMIAEALLDFPVVVQGSFWSHIDFDGRRAKHVDGEDVFASQEIVLRQLGVIDMSANVDTWPHDRVQRAAGSYSLVLTNRQGWLLEKFPEYSDITFEFSPESIADRVDDVLSHRMRYLDMAIAFGDRFRTVYPRERFAEVITPLVEHTRWIWQDPRPQLQTYFVWTKGSG